MGYGKVATLLMEVFFCGFWVYDKKGRGKRTMKRETTPEKITDKVMELCNRTVSGAVPVYVPVEAAGWSQPHECFPNVRRMVQEQGGRQVNGWAVWQWANIVVTLEAHAVWESPEGKLVDITPHDCGERDILFFRDDGVVYSGKPIGSIRQPLTGSPLVAELIELLNERDRIMSTAPGRLCEMPKSLLVRIMQIQETLHREVGRNDPCPCQSGLKYKKCCGRN